MVGDVGFRDPILSSGGAFEEEYKFPNGEDFVKQNDQLLKLM